MSIRDWEGLQESARQGFGDAILCMALLITLERGNQASALEAVNEIGVGETARFYRDGLFFRMHMVAARAFAPSRDKDDTHLRAAIDYLKTNDHCSQQSDPALRKRLTAAISRFDLVAESPARAKIERFRHKQMAHVASYGDELELPIIDELFKFVRDTSEVWEALAHGAGICSVTLASQLDWHVLRADWFWRHIERVDIASANAP